MWKQYRYRTLPLQSYWSCRFKEDLSGLEAAAADDYPTIAPEHSLHRVAERQFSRAVEVIVGGGNRQLADRYLDRSVVAADRLMANNRFMDAPGCSLHFPLNRGMATRVLAYARAMRGEMLDTELLSQASVDFEETARRYDAVEDPQDNNEQTRYYWVDSIHTALISGNVRRAEDLLESIPEPNSYHVLHFALLKQLAARLANELSAEESSDFEKSYCQFYQNARDPRNWSEADYYVPSIIAAVELGMLRYKAIDHPGKDLNLSSVIETLSR